MGGSSPMTAPRAESPIVAVVGDVMNDIVVAPQAEIDVATDTPSRIEVSRGGSAANQAAWLASLGAGVRFAGRAGASDIAGHRHALQCLGVDVRLGEDADVPTGSVVVLVAADGERSMFTDRGANRNLSGDDLDGLLDGVAESGGLLHISAYQLFEPLTRQILRAVWARAERAGIPRSVDPGSFAGVRDAGRESFLAWTAGASLVFPNFAEGRLLSGEEEPEAIVSSLLDTYRIVALKLGRAGALVGSTDGTRVRLAAEPAPVLDSTGAGDAFCAGFLARFVRGAGLAQCTADALASSAAVIGQIGARPSGKAKCPQVETGVDRHRLAR